VNGWRKLPHVPREVQRAFDYPQQFAENIYHRIEQEFARGDSTAGRLHIASGSTASELPAKYKLETSNHADRREGHYLVSYGSAAIKKDLLTEVLGAGQDTKVDGLPPDAVEVLRLMLPASLIATPLA
jgi:hypothetical protein